jgi:tetratricopeptide (TPR) repeat protein
LRAAARRSEGSPVYEFFPGLRVELPEELRSEREQASDYPEVLKRVIEAASPDGLRTGGDAKHVQEWLASAGAPYPTAYLDVLRMFRDAGKHDELIAAYEAFPPDAANDPQALQLLALALNRRSREGDQDRAVAVMRRLVSETGGDAETFAILGRIYKHRWKAGSDPRDLDAAIEYYVAGFEREPADFYTGFNAVTLMFIRGDASNSERFAALFAKVKELVRAQIGPDRTQDYWVNNIAMELAVIERDWQAAQSSLDLALATRPPAFARAAAAESLERLGHRMSGGDAAWIERLVAQLRSTGDADKDDA